MTATAAHNTLNRLYRDHHGWLREWLQRRLGCTQQAADLAHDTFVRVLLKSESALMREPRAFLTTVARALVIDHWRREEVERAWLESLQRQPQAHAPSCEAQQLVLETLERVVRLLEGLKPKVREAFLLAQLEDLSYAQIAERMSVSHRSVERYVAEALYRCYSLRYES